MNMTSRIMEHHQRNASGNGLIIHYMTQNFRMPRDFRSLCYLSQVLQAEAIRYGVEHWRRNRNRVSGTLYWQLNDCWPVVSWASIDYFGRWKALHYAARRFYAPILLSARDEGARVGLHVTSDLASPVRCRLRWRLETLDGRRITEGTRRTVAPPSADKVVAKLDFSRRVNEESRRNLALVCELFSGAGRRISECVVFFTPDKHLDLADPSLSASVRPSGRRWAVTVKARSMARFVEVKFRGVDSAWSDNFFDLPAGRSRTVTTPRAPGRTLAEMRSRLKLFSLRNSF
jgi:beta-mannosidase